MLTARQVSRRLRERRHLMGLTQEGLAAASGLSVETVGRLERGGTHPNLFTFFKLAEALDTTPSALLAETFSDEIVELVLHMPTPEQETAAVILRAMSDHVMARR